MAAFPPKGVISRVTASDPLRTFALKQCMILFRRARGLDCHMELAHLCLADRYIAEGERRVTSQAALVNGLPAGHPALLLAEDLLRLLQ
jgi:hypothetical protein